MKRREALSILGTRPPEDALQILRLRLTEREMAEIIEDSHGFREHGVDRARVDQEPNANLQRIGRPGWPEAGTISISSGSVTARPLLEGRRAPMIMTLTLRCRPLTSAD